jgi:DNA-binding response OmpR family regulator
MRVLVVEDEKKVAALVCAGLEEQGFVVEVCHDGATGLRLAAEGSFDAVVLDVMVPGRDGLSVLRQLRESRNNVPVILLTARGTANERIEGLNLGADDYLPKPFVMAELVARVRAIARRRTGEGLTVVTIADLHVNFATREVRRGGIRIDLTKSEFALLECLLRNPGRPVTRVDMSQQVWKHQFDAGTNFVDAAVKRLRRKIDDPFPAKLIQTVRGLGYSIEDGTRA